MTSNESERTPLMVAVVENDEASLRRLLAEGIDVNEATPIRSGFLGVGSTGGFTALHMAASSGNEVAIPLLIQHGANREAREAASRMTPLVIAAFAKQEQSLLALAACGANVHATDAFGNTVLHFCVEGNLKKAVVALVEAGANPSKADVALASKHGDHETLAILRAGEATRAQEELAKQRATEEKQRAAEELKKTLQATRKSSGQCIMCGRRLNVVQRLFGKDRHAACKSFTE